MSLTADDVQAAERYLQSNEATPDGIRKVKRWLELEWFDWTNHARPDQLAPPGEWLVWLLLAGRGYGKTRTAAEWVKIKGLETPKRRIALVGATLDDVRDTLVEGESGLLSIIPDHELRGGSRETAWNRSMAELYLANGTKYKGFSSNAPEKLRGPQHHCGWVDEPMTFEDADKGIEEPSTTWSNLMLGLRLGAKPQCVVSGTPRRRRMLTGRGRPGDEDYRPGLINMPGVVVTKGSTYDNLDNLAPTFKTRILDMYEGARIGRQELMAEILEDVEGAQWTQKLIDDHKNREQMWQGLGLYRVVIGVDPAVSSSETADFTGIIVAGQNSERHDFVLADRSLRGTPLEWANRAIRAYDEFGAECIVAEKNNGGELVMRNIHAVRPSVPVELVWAKQGKTVRAAPVVTRYEKGLVHHLTVINPLDSLARLEDEMTTWVARDSPESPDRLDAMVWAIWKLSIGGGQPLETEPYVQTGRRGR